MSRSAELITAGSGIPIIFSKHRSLCSLAQTGAAVITLVTILGQDNALRVQAKGINPSRMRGQILLQIKFHA